jgi:hypothetical protein
MEETTGDNDGYSDDGEAYDAKETEILLVDESGLAGTLSSQKPTF